MSGSQVDETRRRIVDFDEMIVVFANLDVTKSFSVLRAHSSRCEEFLLFIFTSISQR